MTDLRNSRFYDLLPPNLQDANALALSYAVDRQMRQLVEYVPITLILAQVDGLNAALCDHLAQAMDVQAYSINFPLEVKRGLIRVALQASSKKGTAGAVREVLGVIHGGARVEEWYQYGGQPYRFRVEVDLSAGGSTALTDEILSQVDAYKNTRSHLDGIDYFTLCETPAYAAAWPVIGNYLIAFPAMPEDVLKEDKVSAAAYPRVGTTLTISDGKEENS